MIRVNKPAIAPDVLLIKGKIKQRILCEEYAAGRTRFTSEDFDGKVYGHETVKAALLDAQFGKCCYCESYVGTPGGDVEHYRPKSRYYWLAYEWSNLLFSCIECNQRFKKDAFPLQNPANRAQSHNDDPSVEQPLLIHPAETDPVEYVTFHNQRASAVDDNPIGRTTIQVLGLNRPWLQKKRRRLLKLLEALLDVAETPSDPETAAARKLFEELVGEYSMDSAEFAGTIRSAKARSFFPRTE